MKTKSFVTAGFQLLLLFVCAALLCRTTFAQPSADFGDAPPPYPTLLADDGARHEGGGGPRLGANRDVENDGRITIGGVSSPHANGDDFEQLYGSPDDEDGISEMGTIRVGQLNAQILVMVSEAASVTIDW